MSEVKQHSDNGPSSSKRRLACPGSRALESTLPDKDSPYAIEGTKAHALGEDVLNAYYLKGQDSLVKDAPDDMIDAVRVYTDYVMSLATKDEVDITTKFVMVERQFDLSWIMPGVFGSCDCVVYDPVRKHLDVIDYKHGQGVAVDADWNTQLMMYALGAMHQIWLDKVGLTKKAITILDMVENVTMTIVQPRALYDDEKIKSWSVPTTELLWWGMNILKPGLEATMKVDAPLATGDHCKFCKAIAVCPAQLNTALAVAKTEFAQVEYALPRPDDMTADDLIKVMEVADMISAWTGSVFAYIQEQALAGRKFPGYKLVAKKTNRAWKDVEEAELDLCGVLGEGAYEKKLLSVAKAEKAIKAIGQSAEVILSNLVEKPVGEPTLVKESDKRQELNVAPALDAFWADSDFLQ